jgi:hypothetical protein
MLGDDTYVGLAYQNKLALDLLNLVIMLTMRDFFNHMKLYFVFVI